MMKYILLAAVFFQAAYSKCPGSCNGHGTCNIHDQCTCFNEDGAGVEYLASDEKIGAVCFKHKASAACAAEAAKADYKCKFDTSVEPNECKRIVKNEIVPSSVKQFTEWTGADCSRRTCPRSTSWTQMGNNVDSKTHICTHKIEQECADQGVCDRATGLCECFPGFTGSACQRTACPDDCSGHGTCRSNRDFAYDFAVSKSHQLLQSDLSTEMFKENYVATYDGAWDTNHLYGCLCDRGYRGANCALIECPSSNDPLDDKCSSECNDPKDKDCVIEEDEYTVENFQVQKFAATGSKGWREAYRDSTSDEQITDPCNVPANLADDGTKCKNVKGPNGETCQFTAAKTKPFNQPARCEQVGVWTLHGPGDKNNHFYNGKVYACFGAMSGMDCSGRGICDYTTGQCSCFSGYSGTSCAKIEELV